MVHRELVECGAIGNTLQTCSSCLLNVNIVPDLEV